MAIQRPSTPILLRQNSTGAEKAKGLNPSVWACFSLMEGLVLLMESPEYIIVSAPLFLAAFVLSIIAILKGHVATGLMMVILVLTMPSFFILLLIARCVS
jgi:hypothetical protein